MEHENKEPNFPARGERERLEENCKGLILRMNRQQIEEAIKVMEGLINDEKD